ncbi:MAG: MarR family transcriptional regulator [Pseudomonadota bacterium]
MTQTFDSALQPAGLTTTQFTTLAMLNGRGPLTVSDLAKHLTTDRTTVNRNLKPLERRGLLSTQTGADQRQRVVSLTDEGHETFDQAVPLWTEAQTSVVKRLGTERWSRLIGDLSAVTQTAP